MDRRPASPEELHELYKQAGKFTLELVKALAQTSFYLPDHPASRTAVTSLYGLFRDLTRSVFEISYVLSSTVDERGVLLEGLTPEPIEIARVLSKTMGEHFVGKLHDHFLRNRIAAFAIKREIGEDEFAAFIGLWVMWGRKFTETQQRSTAALMNEELYRHDVFNVILVGMDEIPGQTRHLSWPTRLALARLAAEFGRYSATTISRSERLAKACDDAALSVMRIIRKPNVAAEVLLNADLAVKPPFSQTQVEEAIVNALPAHTLRNVCATLVERVSDIRAAKAVEPIPGRDPLEYQRVLDRTTRRTAFRLASMEDRDAFPLLEKAHSLGLIETGQLPEELRRKVKAAEVCDQFVASWQAYLREFETCSNPKLYLKYLNVFVVLIPELIRRGLTEVVGKIFEILWHHVTEEVPTFVGRSRFIRETLDALERAGCVQPLVEHACRAPKAARAGLEAGVVLFGAKAVPHLVSHLASEDVSERAAALSMLSRLGPSASSVIMEELRSHRHQWYTVRNLIGILSQHKDPATIAVLKPYMKHPHPKVREEVVQAMANILGDQAENVLLQFLDDENPVVVRKAIQHLGALRSTAPVFLRKVHDAVRIRSRAEDEPDLALQSTCLRALANYEYQLMPETPDLEETLLEAVKPLGIRSKLPGKLGLRQKPVELQVLAIQALGAIGTGRSLSILSDLVGSKQEEIKQAAVEAAERIRQRLTSQVTQSPLKF